jgi:fructose-1-phosphate kinase PfkB-like protein
MATGCGAANALRPGAGSFDRETAERIAEQATVDTIG